MFTGLFSQWSFLNILCNSGCWIIFPVDWFWLTTMKIHTPNSYLGHYQLKPAWAGVKVQFSCSVTSDSLWPRGLQHTRPPCPSPTPRIYSNSCPLSQWCHPTTSSSVVPLLLLPSIFPSIRVFSNESVLLLRWPKFWSFSFYISPSNEYSGLISFRMDWLAVKGILKNLLQHHIQKHQFFSAQLSL